MELTELIFIVTGVFEIQASQQCPAELSPTRIEVNDVVTRKAVVIKRASFNRKPTAARKLTLTIKKQNSLDRYDSEGLSSI
jgi:hypothetical protein